MNVIGLQASDYARARELCPLVEIGPDEKGDSHLASLSDAFEHEPSTLCGCNPDFLGGDTSESDDKGFWSHHTSRTSWQAFVLGVRSATTPNPNQGEGER